MCVLLEILRYNFDAYITIDMIQEDSYTCVTVDIAPVEDSPRSIVKSSQVVFDV